MVLGIKNRVPSRLNVNDKTIPCYNELKLIMNLIQKAYRGSL